MDTPTRAIAEYSTRLTYESLPARSIEATARHLVDSVACALGALDSRPARVARTIAGAASSTRGASVFGLAHTTTPEYAAFANTVMIRYLDYNDTGNGGHPSDMIAAVLAVAEPLHASGKDVITAIHAAYETYAAVRRGGLFGNVLRNKHVDQVYATIGGVVGAGVILGLDVPRMANAIALAITPNIPLRVTRTGIISDWKGCATAHAVMNAVFAARLAEQGLTGPARPFEGLAGFYQMLDIPPLDLAEIGQASNGLTAIESTGLKYFPVDYNAQGPLASTLALREQVSVDEIEQVIVSLHWGGWHAIGGGAGDHDEKWNPLTREVADHSMAYAIAVALADGELTVDSFADGRIGDPALRPLMQRDRRTGRSRADSRARRRIAVLALAGGICPEGRSATRPPGWPAERSSAQPAQRCRTGIEILEHERTRAAARGRTRAARHPVVRRNAGGHRRTDATVQGMSSGGCCVRQQSKRTRLLLLSGGSLVGQNVFAALADRRDALHLSALNSVADEPALFDFDEVYLSGSLRDDREAFAQRFAEILADADPHLVIPCRDDDVVFLAAYAESQPEMAAKFLCGACVPAEVMLDKESSWHFSSRHGLPYAPTIGTRGDPASIAGFAAAQGFPLVAKPRQGFASLGVFLVLDAAQLERIVERRDYVLQRYLGDAEPVVAHAQRIAADGMPLFHSFEAVKLSIQAFIASNGSLAGMFASRNTMRQGCSERVVRDEDPDLAELGARCAQAFSQAGWRGPLNIQCQRTPAGDLMIYEFNGRYTGATAARRLLGYDEVGIALEAFCGFPRAPARTGEALPTEAVRLPVSRAIDQQKVRQLMQTGSWRAAGHAAQ